MRNDQSRSVRSLRKVGLDNNGELTWLLQYPSTPPAPASADWSSDRGLQQLLDQEFVTLHEWVAVLAARHVQDEASLRAALLQWADQAAQLRSEVEGIRDENVSRAAQLQGRSAEQMMLFQQLTGRVSAMQNDMAEQRARIRKLILLASSATFAGTATLIVLLARYFLQ